MLIIMLLGAATAVPLAWILRRNALEQRAMNEAYDLWQATGAPVAGWDRHYIWSEPLPVDGPSWADAAPGNPPRSTPPLRRHRPTPADAADSPSCLRWDQAAERRGGASPSDGPRRTQ